MRPIVVRFFVALLAVLTTPAIGPAVVAQDASGVDGDRYTSPTYGYRLSWDAASWTVSSEEVDRDGWDILRLLYGETGYLYVEGFTGYDGDPEDCLAGTYRDRFADLQDIQPATRGNEPLAGSEDGAAYAGYSYIGYDRDRAIERAAYVSCHTLVPGESVVLFSLVSTGAAFFADLEATQELIASLELPGGGEWSGSSRARDEAPAVPAADGDVYESPRYGYTLAYDPDKWAVAFEDDNPDDVYDRIFLANGTSVVGLTGDPTYDADDLAACVANYVRVFASGDGIAAVEPLDERGAAGDGDDRVWETFAYVYADTDGNEADRVVSFECRWLGDGLTVVVYHSAPADAYAREIAARDDLLEGFAPADESSGR